MSTKHTANTLDQLIEKASIQEIDDRQERFYCERLKEFESSEVYRAHADLLIKLIDPLRELLPTKEEYAGVMGLGMDDLAEKLFPYLSYERRMQVFNEDFKLECEYLAEHGAKLYPHMHETLKKLSETHTLCIVSNCDNGYIQAFLKAHNMAQYFTDYECMGSTGKPKADNIALVVEHNHLKAPGIRGRHGVGL